MFPSFHFLNRRLYSDFCVMLPGSIVLRLSQFVTHLYNILGNLFHCAMPLRFTFYSRQFLQR